MEKDYICFRAARGQQRKTLKNPLWIAYLSRRKIQRSYSLIPLFRASALELHGGCPQNLRNVLVHGKALKVLLI